jgi:SAM-dependent methyltransferase
MSVQSDSSVAAEEARIREVYRRRLARDADRYSLRDPANLYIAHAIERGLRRALARHWPRSLAEARILDVGCGNGSWLRMLMRLGARPEGLTGIDLMPPVIEAARTVNPSAIKFLCSSAAALEFASVSFDLVCQSMVFSSVLDGATRARIAAEMRRVAKPDGLIISYDFFVRSPRNRDTCAIGRRELARLFPGATMHFTRSCSRRRSRA